MRISGACLCFLAFIPNVALADWQYTKWGMSVEESVLASEGRLVAKDEGENVDFPFRWRASGTHDAAGNPFAVKLAFDKENGGLAIVSLTSDNEFACATVLSALRDRGAPDVENSNPGEERYVWRDSESGNIVRFSSSLNLKRLSAGIRSQACYLQYKPLATSESDGL